MQRKYANAPVYRRHDARSMGQLTEQRREQSAVHQHAEQSQQKANLLGRILGGAGGLALVRLLRRKGLLEELDTADIVALVGGQEAGASVSEQVESGTRRTPRNIHSR